MFDKVNELLLPSNILYGNGSFYEVGNQAQKFGSKAMIISDMVMEEIGYVSECKAYLQKLGISYAEYLGVDTEPTTIHVEEAVKVCRDQGCDVLVAIGGGSCIDTAKSVAALITNGGDIADYFNTGRQFDKKSLPLIAVPTTAGTGSEVTKVVVITNVNTNVKMMLAHPALVPSVAIVDPKLTTSCPKNITAATGVDALCHAIEAYISQKAQPVTDILALSAIENIMSYLRIAYSDPNDIEARDKMMVGSMLAGAAFSNASVALVHGMSRPIGALFHVPHGISNAMLLPAVLEFTKESSIERLADIGRRVLQESKDRVNEKVAEDFIHEVKRLCLDLNIPNMKAYGINEAHFKESLPKMAQDAIISGSVDNNPRVPTHDEIMNLYKECFHYEFKDNLTN